MKLHLSQKYHDKLRLFTEKTCITTEDQKFTLPKINQPTNYLATFKKT